MSEYDSVTRTAQDYYNSADADRFYYEIWGGEDIHVGLYESPDEPIRDASRKTVARMADLLEPVEPTDRIIDVGAGYGGAARYLVDRFGCHVACLNLSEVQNEPARRTRNWASRTRSTYGTAASRTSPRRTRALTRRGPKTRFCTRPTANAC